METVKRLCLPLSVQDTNFRKRVARNYKEDKRIILVRNNGGDKLRHGKNTAQGISQRQAAKCQALQRQQIASNITASKLFHDDGMEGGECRENDHKGSSTQDLFCRKRCRLSKH